MYNLNYYITYLTGLLIKLGKYLRNWYLARENRKRKKFLYLEKRTLVVRESKWKDQGVIQILWSTNY